MAATKADHVPQHGQRVPDRMDPRIRRIGPGDPHLHHPIAAPASEPHQLDVVGEAVDGEIDEQVPRHLAVEELETALRVADPAHTQKPDHPVEDLAHPLPIEGLSLGDVGPGHRPTAQHHLGPLEVRLQPLEILDRGGEIRVGEQHASPLTGQDTGAQRSALAPIHQVAEHQQARLVEAPRPSGGLVLAAVVHHQKLERTFPGAQVLEDAPEGRCETLPLVVGGHDHRELRLGGLGSLGRHGGGIVALHTRSASPMVR